MQDVMCERERRGGGGPDSLILGMFKVDPAAYYFILNFENYCQ
jgi:hypothetical protein